VWLFELVGIAVFAASGALAAVRAHLDVFGVVVIGMTTALGGGVIRDVLLGIHPPTSLANWRFLAICAAVSLLVFFFHPQVARLRKSMLILDAAGLGLFTTSATATALAHGVPTYTAVLIGMTSGIGGGALRDVLLRQIPLVLRKEIYAVAGLVGATIVAGSWALHLPDTPLTLIGAVATFGIRILALWRKWNAPRPPVVYAEDLLLHRVDEDGDDGGPGDAEGEHPEAAAGE
jgi:uncharacterized membrane protein YeiH